MNHLSKWPPHDVLLVQRAEIDFYPPVINQANLLAECGLRVAILDGGQKQKVEGLHSSISLIGPFRIERQNQKAVNTNLGMRIRRNLKFLSAMRNASNIPSIKAHIIYDSAALAALNVIHLPGYSIHHFHEHPEYINNKEFSMINLEHRFARHSAHNADLLVIPDEYRANVLVKEESLPQYPQIVRNCPRKLSNLPHGKLRKIVSDRNPSIQWIVLFQGAISTNYYADKIIESMRWWPKETAMIFLGPSRSEIIEHLLTLAKRIEVSDRVFFLPQVPYEQLFSYTVDADLGLSMIKPVTFGFTHAVGASNKRYEFIACGIPQITDSGPGMYEFVEYQEVGICVNAENPEETGHSVSDLLQDSKSRYKMSKRARELHLSEYNYERQFEPIQKKILSVCRNM